MYNDWKHNNTAEMEILQIDSRARNFAHLKSAFHLATENVCGMLRASSLTCSACFAGIMFIDETPHNILLAEQAGILLQLC